MATEEPAANADNLEPFATRTIGTTEPNAGFVIGHYQLLQRIGEGGMGEVWLAEHLGCTGRKLGV